jgi:hypothetical protein
MDPNEITSAISGLADAQPDSSAQAQPVQTSGPQAPSPAQNTAPPPAQPAPQTSAPAMPTGPHAGLRNIMQSLFEGMDAFATSAATGGEKGGVQEIQQLKAQRQDMALKQQANARENTSAAANITHLQALTNATIAQTEINKMNAPAEHQKLVIDNQKSLYDLYTNVLHINPLFAVPIVQGQTTDTHMAGVNAKTNGDLVNNTVIPVHDDKPGGPGNSYGFSFDQLRKVNVPVDQAAPVLTNLQNQIDYARQVLPKGDKDPAIQVAQGRLDVLKKGGQLNGYDFFVFDNMVQSQILQRVAQQQKVTEFQAEQAKAKSAQQAADPLFKMENEPGEMSGEKSSAAIPLLQNKLSDPNTAPADKVRASRLLAQATSAHARYLQDVTAKENASQQAKQGDPKGAAPLLASGDLTLADLKTRGMTPKYITDVIAETKKLDPKYNPADEMAAESVAKSPTQVQFFGSANSLIAKGGTLDQVVDAGSKLPNHTLPIFNKLADAQNYATGHPEVAAYMQTALGAADDYAKVLGGGTGTEGMQMHILNAMNASQNQTQRTSVVAAMKNAVNSQVTERIGTNKFLMRRYGYALQGNQPAAAKFDPKTDFKPITPTQ